MTHADLRDQIKDWVEVDEPTFVANIDNIITKAENKIHTLIKLPDFHASVQGTLGLGVNVIPLPVDLLAINSIFVDGDGLLVKSDDYLQEVYRAQTGKPEVYAHSNSLAATVAPIPDQDYPFVMEYLSRPQSIVVNGSSWLGEAAPSLLLDACLVQAGLFLKYDKEQMDELRAEMKESLSAFILIGEGRNEKDTYRTPDRGMEV